MMLNGMARALLALRRLEELGEQAYRALRRGDQTALPALKEEIDEQVAHLNDGRASRLATGQAFQDLFKRSIEEKLASLLPFPRFRQAWLAINMAGMARKSRVFKIFKERR